MCRLFPILALTVALLTAPGSCGRGDPRPALASERGARWIEALVSPEAPVFVDGFLGGYTEREARLMMTGRVHPQVAEAREALRARGGEAIPLLMRHLEDLRFSLSEVDEVWRNRPVGWVCRDLIEEAVDAVYLEFCRAEPSGWKPRYSREILNGKKLAEAFSDGRTLRDVRRMAVDWIVKKESDRGFPTKEKEEAILGPLRKLRADL